MNRRKSLYRLALPVFMVVAVLALVLAIGPTRAAPGAAAAPADWEVVADGLANPRHLTFGPDGALYVAEAGRGGDGVCVEGPEGEVCYGATGAITRVTWETGRAATDQQQVITGLPSLGAKDTGEAATGPHAVAFDTAGDMYLITGLGAPPDVRDPSGPFGADGANFAQLMTADPVADTFTPWVDLGDYEATENPDGGEVDTNPFGLLAMGEDFLAVDAGGNDLLSVAADGTVETVAVFPDTMVEFPPGTGNMMPMQAVPTSVRVGPDGAYYVGQLTGFPFPKGGASIWRVEPGSAPEVYATGFSAILDFDFAINGSLYVLEMFTNGALGDDPTGAVVRVDTDGTRTVVAREGLILPTGLAIGPDHALYVSNFGLSPDGGQVVRIPTVLSEAKEFVAFLSGGQEVPPVETDAWGMAHFTLDGNTLSYHVEVYDIDNITMSHIHLGARGQNGPVVFPLYTGGGDFGPGKPIMGDLTLTDEQIEELKAGVYYVNVHTSDFPPGEIRGQIELPRAPLFLPAVASD